MSTDLIYMRSYLRFRLELLVCTWRTNSSMSLLVVIRELSDGLKALVSSSGSLGLRSRAASTILGGGRRVSTLQWNTKIDRT